MFQMSHSDHGVHFHDLSFQTPGTPKELGPVHRK